MKKILLASMFFFGINGAVMAQKQQSKQKAAAAMLTPAPQKALPKNQQELEAKKKLRAESAVPLNATTTPQRAETRVNAAKPQKQ
jgi:hypothetical protein